MPGSGRGSGWAWQGFFLTKAPCLWWRKEETQLCSHLSTSLYSSQSASSQLLGKPAGQDCHPILQKGETEAHGGTPLCSRSYQVRGGGRKLTLIRLLPSPGAPRGCGPWLPTRLSVRPSFRLGNIIYCKSSHVWFRMAWIWDCGWCFLRSFRQNGTDEGVRKSSLRP